MIDQLISAYGFSLRYAEHLVEDISEKDADRSGGKGLENSPLFSIGHLVTGAGLTAASFHGENTVDQQIRELFERRGPNDERIPELDGHPFTLRELTVELARQHTLVEQGIRECPLEGWREAKQWRLDQYFPTFADATWFMCVTHEAIHLGQIAAWRRWCGLPSAMARM